ncbi:carbohydrate ABC transporter permease [Paenibacillus cymbidii]|uniref:carbohydrate ABC transporter permease n=1 Tax=Paenibacillus cymbidii TaxID=1639034 RepID=UPI001081E0FF|nr:carbohydrate ABC transporter permease [Paenibacillus cymbidii]
MKASLALRYILLIAASVVFVFPLYWMVTGSVKPAVSLWQVPPDWFPQTFDLTQYRTLLDKQPALRWLFNSLFVGVVSVFFILLFCSLAGYAYAKKRFRGRHVLFFVIIATMMMPRQVTLVPLYLLVSDLGLLDTYAGLILPVIAYPFGVFLIRQFVSYIPDELLNAAKVDGAGEIRIFAQIVVPLILPALGALAIFSFMYIWNDYMWQLVVLTSDNMKTLPLGVSGLVNREMSVNYGVAMAGGTFAALPLIVFFLLFQRSFIRGITLGSDK